MTVKELWELLFQFILIPALFIFLKFCKDYFKAKADKLAAETENEVIAGYLTDITELIYQVVMYTTQTYVESLKSQGAFDLEAQDKAFEKTKTLVMTLLTEDAKDFLTKMYGDIDLWIDTKIEQMVKETKYEDSDLAEAILIAEA